MILFKKVADLQGFLQEKRKQGLSCGLVPTMGALHVGHLSLVEQAQAENDLAVCTIFVNPRQFNEASDLENYPRTEGKDIALLLKVGCAVLFMPPVTEMYPAAGVSIPSFDFHGLDQSMEGSHRPGHFLGVAQVIYRFLEIVQPDALYMGQKDFQQFTIIGAVLHQLQSPVKLVVCPVKREADGLAMSSRNLRLKPAERTEAPLIYQCLQEAREQQHELSPAALQAAMMEKLAQPPSFRPEYFDIVNGHTLEPVQRFSDADYIVACCAVWVGAVRLIDNLVLKP